MVNDLLNRLEGVKQTRHDSWLALCPAHSDSRPSLAITEVSDGRVLMLCRSHGCNWADILAALGLDAGVLFPDKPKGGSLTKNPRVPFDLKALHMAAEFDYTVLAVAASDVSRGIKLSDEDSRKVREAGARFAEQARIAAGRYYTHPREWSNEWRSIEKGRFLLDKQRKAV